MKRLLWLFVILSILLAGCGSLSEAAEILSSLPQSSATAAVSSEASSTAASQAQNHLSEEEYLEKMSEIVIAYSEMKTTLYELVDEADDDDLNADWWVTYAAEFAASVDISTDLFELSDKVPPAYQDNHNSLLTSLDLYTDGFALIAGLEDLEDEEAFAEAWDQAVELFTQADELWMSIIGDV